MYALEICNNFRVLRKIKLMIEMIYFNNLYLVENSGRIHTTGNINGITPNVVLWFPSPNDSCYNWADVDTLQNEVRSERQINYTV